MVEDDDGLLGEGLLEELEEWDKMFDSLHVPEPPADLPRSVSTGTATPVTSPIDVSVDWSGEPPTVVRPDAAQIATASIASRDEEGGPFALPDEDLDLDGRARALGKLLGSPGQSSPLAGPAGHRSEPGAGAAEGRPARGAGEEDDGLVTSAVRPPPDTSIEVDRPAAGSRRSAAIVRRAGIVPKRTWASSSGDSKPRPEPWRELPGVTVPPPGGGGGESDAGGFWPEERTQAVASEVVERLAESAEALFREAPPQVTIELDEDFYEGIEVAATGGEDQPETGALSAGAAPAGASESDQAATRPPTAPGTGAPAAASESLGPLGRPLTGEASARRTSTHIVRRTPISSRRPPTLQPAAPDAGRRARDSGSTAPPARPRAGQGAEAGVDARGLFERTLAGVAPFAAENEVPTREHERPVAAALLRRARRASTGRDNDPEVEAALDAAVAIGDGTLFAAPPGGLADLDLTPDLPVSRFASSEPDISFDTLVVADVEPSIEDRTEELARDLLLYERELAILDEPGPSARLRLEAGRLAEQLGDLDRARMHYDSALQLDPRLRPPLRALRRVERALGNLGEVVRHLDAEIELSSSRERRALAAYRADLLVATGEQDVARVAVGDLVDEAPGDVRALLAHLELAWVDGRVGELDAILDQLAQAVTDRSLAGAMARTRGLLAAARGGDGDPAYRGALFIDSADRLAWMGLAHSAIARENAAEAAELTGHLVGQGGLGQVGPALAGALEWRRGEALIAAGDMEAAGRSIAHAVEVLPDEPDLAEIHARTLAAGGALSAAAAVLARAAEGSLSRWHAARFLRRAAALRSEAGDPGGAAELLRRAIERAPDEPLAVIDLMAALEAAEDDEELAELARRQLHVDLDADAGGRVLPRLRLARLLERLGRPDEALSVLSEGRASGLQSPALDRDLDRAYLRAGKLAERADLCRRQVEEKPPYLDLLAAERRAAASLERLAREQAPMVVAAAGHAAVLAPASKLQPIVEETASAAEPIPELFFEPVSRSLGPADGAESAPQADDEPAGMWREAAADDDPVLRARPAAVEITAHAAALAAWRSLLALEPASAAARAAVLRLSESSPAEERLAILVEAERGEPPASLAIELALRRAELLVARAGGAAGEGGDRALAAEVLSAAAQLDGDDPRSTVALLRLLSAEQRWTEAATLLADRADELGDGEQALAHRFRAAGILIDQAHEVAPPELGSSSASETGETGELRRAASLLTAVVHARPDFVVAAELLRTVQRRLGESVVPLEASLPPPQGGDRHEPDDGFARVLREAEMVELQVGDPGRAAALYQRALQLRPDDPLARDGFARNAERAGDAAPLSELVRADLRQAEELGDGAATAAAYEELARIDAELRGDLAAAILGWGAAVEADPTRTTAMRCLERTYLAGGVEREPELYRLYGRMLETLAGGRDAAAMLGELARLAERTGRPREEILDHFRRLREFDPVNRMALFRLEAQARGDGPSRELAELEQAVARVFSGQAERRPAPDAGDARAEAAFHTRAGETLLALGDRERAVASFRAAVEALPGHVPALHGWRDAAVAGGMWHDVAVAAELAAHGTDSDGERAALHHLAGVVLMDRAAEGERAVGALRRVLDIEPGHTDAFLRLKLLYDEDGQEGELVELYHRRLAVESDAEMRVALHQGLAALYRNFFDDREGARRHLKSALELQPHNLRAIADLSDIAWELGDWAEAAETLIARAKLETSHEVLRHIFYRLGMIYAERLPDPRYAMMSFQKVLTYDPRDVAALGQVADLAARSGDHRLALGACEQLIKLTPSDADKVVHLHRVARIYLDGLNDRQKAERAYRIALDMDPTSEAALMALVRFYREVGDSISARVHLDRVAGAMRQRMARDPLQVQPVQVLARALEAREQTGVPGSRATAQCAAEIAVLLGSTDERDAGLAAAARSSRPPLSRLAGSELDDLLFPAPVSSSLRALFRLLGDRIAKQLGIDVRRYGVGRAERLRAGSDPLAGMVVEMAGEMGFGELDVYLSQRQPTVLAVEPTNPPSLILGAQLASVDRPAELRFLVGRSLKLARASLAVPARMSVDELGALVAGMLRQFSPDFTPTGLDPAQVSAEQQKLRRLIPSHMVQELAPFGLDIAGAGFDHRAMWAGIIDGGNRAGLLAAGSASAAIASILRLGGHRTLLQGVRDPFVTGLLDFAVSEDHALLSAELDT